MTKRVAVANLSSWDGEDFEITIQKGDETNTVVIRPGGIYGRLSLWKCSNQCC